MSIKEFYSLLGFWELFGLIELLELFELLELLLYGYLSIFTKMFKSEFWVKLLMFMVAVTLKFSD